MNERKEIFIRKKGVDLRNLLRSRLKKSSQAVSYLVKHALTM